MAPDTFDLKTYLNHPLFIKEHKLLLLNVFQCFTTGDRMNDYRERVEFNSEELPTCLIRYSMSPYMHIRDRSLRSPLAEFAPPGAAAAAAGNVPVDEGVGGIKSTVATCRSQNAVRLPASSESMPTTTNRLAGRQVDLISSSGDSSSEDEGKEEEEEEEEEAEAEEEEKEEDEEKEIKEKKDDKKN